jgi:hypothetical protein
MRVTGSQYPASRSHHPTLRRIQQGLGSKATAVGLEQRILRHNVLRYGEHIFIAATQNPLRATLGGGSTAEPRAASGAGRAARRLTISAIAVTLRRDRSLAPDVPPADLAKVVLSGSVTPGGNDSVAFTYESEAYSTSYPDSVLDISSVWNKAEFNVVGNGGGSQANFNAGSSITVFLNLGDGSTSAPACLADGGSTGESNNLNVGSCSRFGGGLPSIRFTESN